MKMRDKLTGRTKVEQIQKKADFDDFLNHIEENGTLIEKYTYFGVAKELFTVGVYYINGMIADYTLKNGVVKEYGLSVKPYKNS